MLPVDPEEVEAVYAVNQHCDVAALCRGSNPSPLAREAQLVQVIGISQVQFHGLEAGAGRKVNCLNCIAEVEQGLISEFAFNSFSGCHCLIIGVPDADVKERLGGVADQRGNRG